MKKANKKAWTKCQKPDEWMLEFKDCHSFKARRNISTESSHLLVFSYVLVSPSLLLLEYQTWLRSICSRKHTSNLAMYQLNRPVARLLGALRHRDDERNIQPVARDLTELKKKHIKKQINK